MSDDERNARLSAIQGVLDLMSNAQLPFDKWDHDTIAPQSNGYSVWFIGSENFVHGQMLGTAPLTAEQILQKIEAREADTPSGKDHA